jgi:hypothetical protein
MLQYKNLCRAFLWSGSWSSCLKQVTATKKSDSTHSKNKLVLDQTFNKYSMLSKGDEEK